LNPDEFLNANLKHSVTTAAPARRAKALTRTAVAASAASRNNPHASKITSNIKTMLRRVIILQGRIK
jgi:hypothetical protein